ncbi:MAG: pectate lyase [Bacteroidetes bacterium]|nr:pectate lyase [Bacteroidota bacterium]MBS1931869.1 pectate lyase [Bacteroidota bacterium]
MNFLATENIFAQDSIADVILLYQRSIGGWPKHIGGQKIDYTKYLTDAEKEDLLDEKSRNDATIDNKATTKEIRYLIKAHKTTGNKSYLDAAEKGIHYLLIMQEKNGGWPQFYPDSSIYRSEITFNDNAMINAMNVLWDVIHRSNGFDMADTSLITPSVKAIDAGIQCILKTQIEVHGKLTAWCAQYDKTNLKPAKARSYELISISGEESVGIVEFLMKIENPSYAIKSAISSAVDWLKKSGINGFRYDNIKDISKPGGIDRVLIRDKNSRVWARFYDIETNKPFFSGRDGSIKWSLSEIEAERRNGYAWYGTWPRKLLEIEFPE